MASRYPIPAETTRIELRIVNSRFIATIAEARTADDARAFIDLVRAEFSDASHNVYAFRAGYGGSVIEGMSDDGEPSGTAGRPILSVLRGADLGDVVIVVTRYFGGTKLGTGGLVRAYTESAQEALAALPIIERVERRQGLIGIPYPLFERTKQLISTHHGEVTGEEFGAEVVLSVIFPVDDCAAFDAALLELTNGRIQTLWET